MSEDNAQEVRQTVRFPKEVHDAIAQLAAGDSKRPPSSFNQTLLFVLRKGLAAVKESKESGNRIPAPSRA
jgi:hypothetical protein